MMPRKDAVAHPFAHITTVDAVIVTMAAGTYLTTAHGPRACFRRSTRVIERPSRSVQSCKE